MDSNIGRRSFFLLKIDRDWGIVIFSSDWQLELMAYCTTLLSDGTFKTGPKLFYQLYVACCVVNDRKLPLSRVLLKSKTTGIYRRMLQILKRELQRKSLQLTVTEIVCDFELGFKSAIETDFTQVRLWGWYSHFTKALMKKMKDLGLFFHYSDHPLLNRFLRKFFAIIYLTVFYVRQNLYQLTQSTNARILKNAYPQLVFFLQDFEHTWFTTFPRMSTMSTRALLLYVQSTHARDTTTDSMSEWEKG